MNQAFIFYNPFLPELRISVNGQQVSPFSALTSYRHQRIEKWCDCLFDEIYREINSDFEVICESNDFACAWLKTLADRNSHCRSFISRPLPVDTGVYDRLLRLELLGCDEVSESIAIPVFNASGDSSMVSAVFTLLAEQGIFEEDSFDRIVWSDCPMTAVSLVSCYSADDMPRNSPVAIALCSNEDDSVPRGMDMPMYALVMGAETGFIRRSGGILYFSVDPDDMEDLILHILEEEVFCPLLSQLSYEFPSDALMYLTDAEKEELDMICMASPGCRMTVPKMCYVGRSVDLHLRMLPSTASAAWRLVSDQPHIVDVDDGILHPLSQGTARISVMVGDDPYPVADAEIQVYSCRLIESMHPFPSVLGMPVGGCQQVSLSVSPENAENGGEIRWSCSDSTVAEVDPETGMITAVACGRCVVSASTPEASCDVELTVLPDLVDIVCPCSFLEINVGEYKEWRYRVVPADAYGVDLIRVFSSDQGVAEYRGGYIVGNRVGDCRIIVKNESGSICRELKVAVRKGKRLF